MRRKTRMKTGTWRAMGFADVIRVEGEGILRIPGAFWIVQEEEGSEEPPQA
jgi:hypothetical protein